GDEDVFVARKLQRGKSQLVNRFVVQRQSRGIVRHHASQTVGDRGEQLVEIQIRDQRVVDFQQQLGTIALAGEFVLITLRLDGNRDLRGDELGKVEIEMIVSAWFVAPEVNYTKLLMRGRQRNTANRFHRTREQQLGIREAIFLFQIANHDGFLMLPHPTRDR